MRKLANKRAKIKASRVDVTAILRAAYDGKHTTDMCAAVLAHPLSAVLLEKRSVKRLFAIAYKGAPYCPTDVEMVNVLALGFLHIEEART